MADAPERVSPRRRRHRARRRSRSRTAPLVGTRRPPALSPTARCGRISVGTRPRSAPSAPRRGYQRAPSPMSRPKRNEALRDGARFWYRARHAERRRPPGPCGPTLSEARSAMRPWRFTSDGEVAEWLNAPHSKCGIRATVSGVQIPPSPPFRVHTPPIPKPRLFRHSAHRGALLRVAETCVDRVVYRALYRCRQGRTALAGASRPAVPSPISCGAARATSSRFGCRSRSAAAGQRRRSGSASVRVRRMTRGASPASLQHSRAPSSLGSRPAV